MAFTLLDPDSDIDGTVRGKDAQVQGRFRGDITVSGRLVIAEGARVEARVTAETVEIAGHFTGELTARSLVLLEKARVDGSIQAQALSVREGAQINGPVNAGGEASRTVRPSPAAAAAPPAPAPEKAGPLPG